MDIIDRLHNCPNCGGTLQDDGACRFCGSRVYDFVSVDMENYKPTYLRMKIHGKIIIMPVRFCNTSIRSSIESRTLHANEDHIVTMEPEIMFGQLEFIIVGDTIVEDTKITGSEY